MRKVRVRSNVKNAPAKVKIAEGIRRGTVYTREEDSELSKVVKVSSDSSLDMSMVIKRR